MKNKKKYWVQNNFTELQKEILIREDMLIFFVWKFWIKKENYKLQNYKMWCVVCWSLTKTYAPEHANENETLISVIHWTAVKKEKSPRAWYWIAIPPKKTED